MPAGNGFDFQSAKPTQDIGLAEVGDSEIRNRLKIGMTIGHGQVAQ